MGEDLFGKQTAAPLMSNTQRLAELKRLVEIMRGHQKTFFKTSPGTRERNAALVESKKAEQAVDKFLKQISV